MIESYIRHSGEVIVEPSNAKAKLSKPGLWLPVKEKLAENHEENEHSEELELEAVRQGKLSARALEQSDRLKTRPIHVIYKVGADHILTIHLPSSWIKESGKPGKYMKILVVGKIIKRAMHKGESHQVKQLQGADLFGTVVDIAAQYNYPRERFLRGVDTTLWKRLRSAAELKRQIQF